jgi:hypothetical protein
VISFQQQEKNDAKQNFFCFVFSHLQSKSEKKPSTTCCPEKISLSQQTLRFLPFEINRP